MKRLLLTLGVGALLAGASPAAAQRWTTMAERKARLDDRIDAGVRTGTLTAVEATRLRGEFRDVARLEARYRSDGLSTAERRDLDRRFDALSRRIREERADDDTGWFGLGGWRDHGGRWVPVNARQKILDERIDRGVASGRLTATEAARLRREYRAIARVEARYRRGGLNVAERADLDRRFDRLAARIRVQATDAQWGYGYGPARR